MRLRSANADANTKLKAQMEVKNQIIGNCTKKLSYINLGVVLVVVSILTATAEDYSFVLVLSVVALCSFTRGFEASVQAVLHASAFPRLWRLPSYSNRKVADAGARSLRMIYQSKLAPKHHFLQEKNMEFLLSLLNIENENVTRLGASIITHSYETSAYQNALCDAGVLKKLIGLLQGSLSQRDASLESIATVIKSSPEVVSKFVGPENGRECGGKRLFNLLESVNGHMKAK